ncbi:MAG TPA: nucleotidyltransferase domain-containing protein [bacterium]|nr:nucleotidyltransferase domain-containing protein [bacterium]HOL34411.1 nucleotidyltransferase domain-containing protein [bacterium]HPP08672.1 nucleotidyltransferase domain-containing protein [bacterium]
MNKSHIQILKDIKDERKHFFENYLDYASRIKKEAKKILKDVEVIVFGSVVRGDWHPLNSDIDLLIISENMPDAWEKRRIIRNKIKSFLPSFHPFQIHLVTKKEYENFYKKAIKDTFKTV